MAMHKTARSRRPLICQVAYSMKDKEGRERELRGVAEAARHLRVARVTVVTFNDEEHVVVDGIEVDIVPAWKWLLAADTP